MKIGFGLQKTRKKNVQRVPKVKQKALLFTEKHKSTLINKFQERSS